MDKVKMSVPLRRFFRGPLIDELETFFAKHPEVFLDKVMRFAKANWTREYYYRLVMLEFNGGKSSNDLQPQIEGEEPRNRAKNLLLRVQREYAKHGLYVPDPNELINQGS